MSHYAESYVNELQTRLYTAEEKADRYREALKQIAAYPDQPGHQKAREQREMVAIAKAAVGGDPE